MLLKSVVINNNRMKRSSFYFRRLRLPLCPNLDESGKFSEEIFIKCIFTAIKQTVAI